MLINLNFYESLRKLVLVGTSEGTTCPKDKPPSLKTLAIYTIKYEYCPLKYIGQTKHSDSAVSYVRREETEKSSEIKYIHLILWAFTLNPLSLPSFLQCSPVFACIYS